MTTAAYLNVILDAAKASRRSDREISRAATGKPTAIAMLKTGRIPSVERARQLCGTLGLEFYIGPPRAPCSFDEAAMLLAESRWAAPLFATLRQLLTERIEQRGERIEEIAARASLAPSEVRHVIERNRIPLDHAAKLCDALDAEICARPTEGDTWELGEQPAEVLGLAPGPIRTRALARTLVRASGMEPEQDPIDDALPAQPPPPDRRLSRLLTWIKEWWSVNEPDRRIWLYEDIRQQYPAFEGWLREGAGQSRGKIKKPLQLDGASPGEAD